MVLVVSGCGRELGIKNEELGIKDSGGMGGLVEQVATTTGEDLAVASSSNDIICSSSLNNMDIKDWLTYKNDEYGYTIKYPKNVKNSENKYYVKEFDLWQKYTVFSDGKYFIVFQLNKRDESFGNGRSGVGAGDFEIYKTVCVNNFQVEIKKLVYENKIREIFFSGHNSVYTIDGYISYKDDSYDNSFVFDESWLSVIENMLESVKFKD